MDVIQKVYFTDEAVNDFLINKLDFSNWKIILRRDKLEFLTCLQQKHLVHVYFQNIGMSALPVESRSLPTIEKIIQTGLSGRGGPCFILNYFFHLLLAALGFDTFVVRSTISRITPIGTSTIAGVPEDTHVLTIARLQKDELLVRRCISESDGCSDPASYSSLPATCRRYQIGGRYVREILTSADDPQEETLRFEFDLVPRSLSYFERPMRPMFTDPNASINFLRRPFLFRYLKHQFTEPEANEWVLVFGMKIVLGTKHERKVLEYLDYGEMMPSIWKYFPGLDKDEVKLAFQLFEETAAAQLESAAIE